MSASQAPSPVYSSVKLGHGLFEEGDAEAGCKRLNMVDAEPDMHEVLDAAALEWSSYGRCLRNGAPAEARAPRWLHGDATAVT